MAAPASVAESNKEVVRRLEDALNRQDLVAVAKLHGDEVMHQGFKATRENFMTFWSDILLTFPDHHVTIDRLFADEDWVIELMTMSGTHRGQSHAPHHGDLRDVEPSGKSFRAKQAHFWRIRDGLIIEHEVVRDDLGIHRQLGLAPSRPSSHNDARQGE